MTTSSDQASATIYQFPARGRFAEKSVRNETAPATPQVVSVAAGSGWYHEAAIEDAERTRKI